MATDTLDLGEIFEGGYPVRRSTDWSQTKECHIGSDSEVGEKPGEGCLEYERECLSSKSLEIVPGNEEDIGSSF